MIDIRTAWFGICGEEVFVPNKAPVKFNYSTYKPFAQRLKALKNFVSVSFYRQHSPGYKHFYIFIKAPASSVNNSSCIIHLYDDGDFYIRRCGNKMTQSDCHEVCTEGVGLKFVFGMFMDARDSELYAFVRDMGDLLRELKVPSSKLLPKCSF